MIWLRYCGTLLVPFLLCFRYSSSIKAVWNHYMVKQNQTITTTLKWLGLGRGEARSSLELIILAWGRQRWVHIYVGKLKNHWMVAHVTELLIAVSNEGEEFAHEEQRLLGGINMDPQT